jgi:hypothetical protein
LEGIVFFIMYLLLAAAVEVVKTQEFNPAVPAVMGAGEILTTDLPAQVHLAC